ncbi:hypothetical protein EJ05DRAFT_533796 [Pseudovirgaria hyperparasitica]|uniref:Histidine kinase group protein n=1 Tax=Pseudovirgaria hyperparasitica TaxID=470096 RepID=A0A6A6VTD3_9PEZI|nr:uncharacterized protein EJ05DRAFT_533796 [Pseudovirgaria hyperparasitica]KAF2753014.1 hypothetical protein EJ05DRAFT_533796 [Pseudovirgaria hyperparasitica]
MAKKNKSQAADSAETSGTGTPPVASSAPSPKPFEHSTYSLNICRNKHWRYISSFHGPWLQLPPEVLESLAHSNYFSPRPHSIDPAVLFDLVKVRRRVEEATTLAVRAASGLTSAALNNSLNSSHGFLGDAAALGLGYGSGGHGKMSREAKHRMRISATQKLSEAYRLDEIAASVATMQGTATLEDVALHVLKRQPADIDAKYVHFFHEKIPSRMMAECTTLDPLNEVISDRPSEGAALRTRALTRVFKEDFYGAASDLTEGIAIARYWAAQHQKGQDQLVLLKQAKEQWGSDWRRDAKVEEKDQPGSLESQMLFHRAGVYFTIACSYVPNALEGLKQYEAAKNRKDVLPVDNGLHPSPPSDADEEGHRRRIEARKNLRAYAKRALRDYNAFLSRLEYTPGLSREDQNELMMRFSQGSGAAGPKGNSHFDDKIHDASSATSNTNSNLSDSLVPKKSPYQQGHARWSRIPAPKVFKVSELFSPSLPAGLPPFPADSTSLETFESRGTTTATSILAESAECVTYHPLLTDAMHSLLLCHTLLQTPPKELLRHSHNVARIARVCDGYPIFLPARSPARADWIEVLRRTNNWIGITQSWETLCKPTPLPGHGPTKSKDVVAMNGAKHKATKVETPEQRRERQKHEAVMEALADERVVDEDSFQRATAASSATSPSPSVGPAPKRWAQDDGKEYPITTERADAISRWVREAPLTVEGGAKSKKSKKSKGKGKKVEPTLADSVATLGLDDELHEDEEVD